LNNIYQYPQKQCLLWLFDATRLKQPPEGVNETWGVSTQRGVISHSPCNPRVQRNGRVRTHRFFASHNRARL